jgi:hypothetical protein
MSTEPVGLSITGKNAVERVNECLGYLKALNWPSFDSLFASLVEFEEAGISSPDFTNAWRSLRETSSQLLTAELQSVESFDDFKSLLQRLSTVLSDPADLWRLLHDQFQCKLKITMHQTQILAVQFFSPPQLFEFGFERFSRSLTYDLTHTNSDEGVIDVFYAIAGYVRACGVSPQYLAVSPEYYEFIQKILTRFITLPDFDAHRFVWLIEMAIAHLKVDRHRFQAMCDSTIRDFLNSDLERSSLNRLYKLCVLSTSPFLNTFPQLRQSIENHVQIVLNDNQVFIIRYVIPPFCLIDWQSHGDPGVADPVQCWRLYMQNLAQRVKERPELPSQVLVEQIDESMNFFSGYFAEIQPIKTRAIVMRTNIFVIVGAIGQIYPGIIPAACLSRLWYLMYIAAISGATEEEIKNCKPDKGDKESAPFLGLDLTQSDFCSYPMALARLSKKFEPDFDRLPTMASFIRANY